MGIRNFRLQRMVELETLREPGENANARINIDFD
jgi:predicted DNA-binding transcriptional regulator YafY